MSESFPLVQEASQKATISLICAVTEGSRWAQAAVTGMTAAITGRLVLCP